MTVDSPSSEPVSMVEGVGLPLFLLLFDAVFELLQCFLILDPCSPTVRRGLFQHLVPDTLHPWDLEPRLKGSSFFL